MFRAQVGHQVKDHRASVNILAEIEQISLDRKRLVAGRRLRTDIHHCAEDAFIVRTVSIDNSRQTGRRHVHAALGQELVLFYLKVRRRKADGMPEALSRDNRP